MRGGRRCSAVAGWFPGFRQSMESPSAFASQSPSGVFYAAGELSAEPDSDIDTLPASIKVTGQRLEGETMLDSLAVVVIDFNRHPAALIEKIKSLQVTKDLEGKGIDVIPSWARGAKILVEGCTEATFGGVTWLKLDFRHVVCTPEVEALIMKTIRDIPRKQAVYPRARYVGDCTTCTTAAHPDHGELLCLRVRPLPRFVFCLLSAVTRPPSEHGACD